MKIGGLKISRDELAESILSFCVTNNLFSEPELMNMSAESIANQLEYKHMVEMIIQILIEKSSKMEYIDLKKLQELLIELNEIRHDLAQLN
ncbi:MAG: hypothetical protein LBH09_07060 [Peptococcaceae bacterium]|jgi:hypothetical protein|nr:hypothetical protein [Peptococcaceae bacterium]